MQRLASLFRIKPKTVEIAENWFQKAGFWMVFLSRMTPFVRPFACFPAGISRMPVPRFFVAASAGSIIWCIALLSIGWNLGHRWRVAFYFMQRYTLPTVGGVVLLFALYVLVMYLVKRYLGRFGANAPTSDMLEHKQDSELLEV